MDPIIEIGLLLSAYGSLLTVNQEDLMEAYYFNDLSLQEIAENAGISKQAVSDQVRKARNKLRKMEDKVHHVEMVLACQSILGELDRELDGLDPEDAGRIKPLINQRNTILYKERREG